MRFWKAVTRSSVMMYWISGGKVRISVLKASITILWSLLRFWEDRDFSMFGFSIWFWMCGGFLHITNL